ncbi:SGNH/GDSL hydrolase family protein [Echinicola vietnamensis]|uniref:Lysophospholipase L1-like esterase n=1 Tax=Echinicola vietnamensis (strain DSM 17526 / LMG 23754 / KMM 6221) TaxID=926556 RepID=L0FTR2_ECHVK|nr:SGNH/GDSL hydrolase family protein [Echinicola vietnamensis]AGA76687.1 lysophospholipase L1-like esterase [Echinicola vietnamensis DSM 17526]
MRVIIFAFSIFMMSTCSVAQNQKVADTATYLSDLKKELTTRWPNNRTINLVFHGHSVPAGYWHNSEVHTLDSYPNIVLAKVKQMYPHAVVNVIVTAIGGEYSEKGQPRVTTDVLPHKPDVLFIDYALNDLGIGLERAGVAWEKMIGEALEANLKVILVTPSPDQRHDMLAPGNQLEQHAEQIRKLAAKYGVGLADPFAEFQKKAREEGDIKAYMSHVNHPNRRGHELIASEIVKWF